MAARQGECLDGEEPAPTVMTNNIFRHPDAQLGRNLTLRQCARLQSIPDSQQFSGTPAEIRRQIGNAVPPPLAKAVGEAVMESYKTFFSRAGSDAVGDPRATAAATPLLDPVIDDVRTVLEGLKGDDLMEMINKLRQLAVSARDKSDGNTRTDGALMPAFGSPFYTHHGNGFQFLF